jgi:hypothetical protein
MRILRLFLVCDPAFHKKLFRKYAQFPGIFHDNRFFIKTGLRWYEPFQKIIMNLYFRFSLSINRILSRTSLFQKVTLSKKGDLLNIFDNIRGVSLLYPASYGDTLNFITTDASSYPSPHFMQVLKEYTAVPGRVVSDRLYAGIPLFGHGQRLVHFRMARARQEAAGDSRPITADYRGLGLDRRNIPLATLPSIQQKLPESGTGHEQPGSVLPYTAGFGILRHIHPVVHGIQTVPGIPDRPLRPSDKTAGFPPLPVLPEGPVTEHNDRTFSYARPGDISFRSRAELSFADTRRVEALVDEVRKTVQDIKVSTESGLMSIRDLDKKSPIADTEIHRISDQVVRMLDSRFTIERERRGYY